MSARLFAARLVSAHHPAVLAFLLVGWALPWTWSLWTALAVYPLVQLNWWCFGNRCALSVLEERLRSAAAPAEIHFVQRLCKQLLGRPVSRRLYFRT